MSSPGPPKHRRHLMTPGPPRPVVRNAMSLTSVQRWVMSTLAASTGLHLSGGLVLAARYVDPQSSKIGLLLISGAFGVLAMAGALLIHRSRLPHPLLLVGLLPALVGGWWIFS